jgi:hypothetical protein
MEPLFLPFQRYPRISVSARLIGIRPPMSDIVITAETFRNAMLASATHRPDASR